MKTIFKVGMKVYDQLNFPNKEGVVVEVNNDESDEYPIGVSFENEEGRYYYTPEGCFYKEQISTLSTKPYKVELVGFEQKSPAPTYGEALVKAKTNFNGYPSYELAMAAEALQKLLFLRDYYNEGWQPNWRDESEEKYSIGASSNKLFATKTNRANYILTFREESIRDKFLEEQKELLEIAKPLL